MPTLFIYCICCIYVLPFLRESQGSVQDSLPLPFLSRIHSTYLTYMASPREWKALERLLMIRLQGSVAENDLETIAWQIEVWIIDKRKGCSFLIPVQRNDCLGALRITVSDSKQALEGMPIVTFLSQTEPNEYFNNIQTWLKFCISLKAAIQKHLETSVGGKGCHYIIGLQW